MDEGKSLLFFCHTPKKWGHGTPTPKSGGYPRTYLPYPPVDYAYGVAEVI